MNSTLKQRRKLKLSTHLVSTFVSAICISVCVVLYVACIKGGPKSKPLPNNKKIVLNGIKVCQWH